jgi:hypothetical protein
MNAHLSCSEQIFKSREVSWCCPVLRPSEEQKGNKASTKVRLSGARRAALTYPDPPAQARGTLSLFAPDDLIAPCGLPPSPCRARARFELLALRVSKAGHLPSSRSRSPMRLRTRRSIVSRISATFSGD